MSAFVSLGSESFGASTEIEVNRPVTVRQISERLNKKPFEIIADLMALNCYASIQTELSDETLHALGSELRVVFRIISSN